MTLVLEFLARFWKPLAGVALCAALYTCGHHDGTVSTNKEWKAKHDAQQAADDAALAAAQAHARDVEQKAAQQVSEIESKLHEQQTQASANQSLLLASVRAGTVSLRDRFTCPATPSIGVPATPTRTSGDHGAEKRGLQREDAEFLVSEAGRADAIARQLTACQSLLKQERGS